MRSDTFIVSLDFDGVIAQGLAVKRKYAKKWFDVDLSLEQTKKDGFNALMKHMGKREDYRSLMDPVNEHHIMEYEIPEGCLTALADLFREGFRFVVITSRNEHDYPYALMFLKKRFRDLIKYVHNTRNQPKDKFVRRLKPRIHIDDDVSKLAELNNLPIELFYYRQPENSHQPPIGRMVDIKTWQEFYERCRMIRLLHEAICWKYKIANKYSNIKEIYELAHQQGTEAQINFIKEYQKSIHE